MKLISLLISGILLVLIIGFLIFLIAIGIYTVYFIEWKNSPNCDEVYTVYSWNSPMIIPEELKENVTRCYTFTIGGSSKGIKLFENGNYIGQKYFGDYRFGFFSEPHKF